MCSYRKYPLSQTELDNLNSELEYLHKCEKAQRRIDKQRKVLLDTPVGRREREWATFVDATKNTGRMTEEEMREASAMWLKRIEEKRWEKKKWNIVIWCSFSGVVFIGLVGWGVWRLMR